jgi:hypothetical protein
MLVAFYNCPMKFLCRHCDQVKTGTPYRVVSKEEAGDILLDMVVCHSCYVQARDLGLQGEVIGSQSSRKLHDNGYAEQ